MQKDFIDLFAQVKPRKVVETGTYLGLGTTTLLHNAAVANGLIPKIYTIECNPRNYQKAYNYFWEHKLTLVQPRLGLSIPRFMLPTLDEVRREYVELADTQGGKIYYDHNAADRAERYIAETSAAVEDDLLNTVLHEGGDPVDIFLLDSAGHVGQIEFHYLLGLLLKEPKLVTSPFYVILDDTRHCKHVKTLAFIRANPNWSVLADSPDRFGWAIAKLIV